MCCDGVLCAVQACSGLGPHGGSSATVEVEGASHLGLLTTKPFLHALAAVLDVPEIPAQTGLRGGARVSVSGSSIVARAMPVSIEQWDGVAEVASTLQSQGSGRGGGEEWERGLVERMHGAAAAVVAAGCAERRRLEAVFAEGGAPAAWEEAALAWHRQWHDCDDGAQSA